MGWLDCSPRVSATGGTLGWRYPRVAEKVSDKAPIRFGGLLHLLPLFFSNLNVICPNACQDE